MGYIPIMEYVRRLLLGSLLLTGVLAPAGGASSAELLMFERAGCPWCARWNREVAPGYVQSDEGRYAPLRRVDIDQGQPQGVQLKLPVRYTPTFVLVDEGREIGRLIGYIDAATFWGLFAKMVRDHREGRDAAPVNPPTGGRSG